MSKRLVAFEGFWLLVFEALKRKLEHATIVLEIDTKNT